MRSTIDRGILETLGGAVQVLRQLAQHALEGRFAGGLDELLAENDEVARQFSGRAGDSRSRDHDLFDERLRDDRRVFEFRLRRHRCVFEFRLRNVGIFEFRLRNDRRRFQLRLRNSGILELR